MPIVCNCCGCDNAPMAVIESYWICDDCFIAYGSYEAALEDIKGRWKSAKEIPRVATDKPQDNI